MAEVGASFDHNRHPTTGIPSGYVLPDPALFANNNDDGARQAYLKTYLKLRESLLYRIENMGTLRCLKSTSDWQKLIGLELHGYRTESRGAERRSQLVNELQGSLVANSVVSIYSHILNLTNGLIINFHRILLTLVTSKL